MSNPTMPNVLVYPPEEDHDPPFVAFDAAAQLLQHDYDLDYNPELQSVLEPTLIIRRDPFGQRSIADILTSEDEADEFPRDVSVDSEVIEVVKLRRSTKNDSRPAVPPTSTSEPAMKRSKTLRYKASRAFHSIKNVARSSRSKKQHVGSNPVDTDYDEPVPRASSTSSSRRSSVYFSQLFTAPTALKTRLSSESFNEDVSPSPVTSSTSSIPTMVQPISSAEMQSFTPYPDSDYDDDDDDDGDEQNVQNQVTPRAVRHTTSLRSPSPTPSTASSRLGRRRFSVLNLFTSSSTSAKLSDSDSTQVAPAMTRDPPAASTDSSEASLSGSSGSSILATPVDEVAPSLPSKPSKVSRLRGFSFSKKKEELGSSKEPHPTRVEVEVEVAEPLSGNDPDMTIGEMRLDSLHFDDLSFDVGRF
ncbi:hypothetical protein K435DRAFT_837714 [Dendrothele bispora CBS 962.96]|uniref:Uncharacterized protein n=1 Tax=Dendrothele bispora (strain CBS 962.96) TaxID=1314807 RepID=A0A4S8MA98_DENBC|nr:hypothetical protein K435DRAFT_837714 [Dendrothele bispora CBS 962.96]